MGVVRTGLAALAVVVTMVTVSSCMSGAQPAGTPSQPAGPTPTDYTLKQVRAAIPGKATLQKTYDEVSSAGPTKWVTRRFCGDKTAPKPSEGSWAAISAQSPREAAGWNVYTNLEMSGVVFPSSQAAERFVRRARTTATQCEGKIDLDPVQVEGGWRPGERGRGTLSDVTVGGWQGFRLLTVSRWITPDGAVGPSMAHGAEILRHGDAVVVVTATQPDDKPKAVTRTLDRWTSRFTREVG